MTEETTTTQTAERPRRTWSPNRIRAEADRRERLRQERERREGLAAELKQDLELVAEEVMAEAVANMKTLGGFIAPFAPYTGFTIMGVPAPADAPEGTPPIVLSRAELAGHALLEHARRDARVLRAVHRFNRIMRNAELMEATTAVAVSAVIDLRVAPADAAIKLPGPNGQPIALPIFQSVIPDTIEFVGAHERAARAARGGVSTEHVSPRLEPEPQPQDGQRGRRREGQAVVEGGVQGT